LSSPVVQGAGIIKDTKVVLAANFFNDPTPDGRFGYRLEIPAGAVQGVRISVAEGNVNKPGLTDTEKKKKCTQHRHGKCTKRSVKKTKLFWFTEPTCPSSNQLPFESVYQYEGVSAPVVKDITVPCPPFKH